MLSRKLFCWVHKIALFAVVFASIAPSVSYALAAQQGGNSFVQEICTTGGETITIKVVTRQGKQLSTELNTEKQAPSPANIAHHLNHCPFCSSPNTDNAIEAPLAPIIATLEMQAQQLAVSTQVVLPRFSVLPPPAQAPPAFH